MGLWEFLRQWPRARLATGIVVSVLVHVLVAWAVLWGLKGELMPRWVPKKGDTIIVELPKPEEPATAGNPTAQPPPAPRPAPARPPAPAASRPSPPRETPPPPREERRVASADSDTTGTRSGPSRCSNLNALNDGLGSPPAAISPKPP